jgi:hypothetical protein
MIQRTYRFLESHLLSILLLGFYATEAFNKILYFEIGGDSSIPGALKLGVFMFFAIHVFVRFNRAAKQILFVIFCFVIGQLFIDPNFIDVVLVNTIKYIFPLVALAYINYRPLDQKASKELLKLFKWVIVFNSALIILGFVFDIFIFESYKGHRFGYNGLFITSATASYVYIIALIYFLETYKNKFFYNIGSIIVLISCFLIGTKAIYIVLFFILGFYFYRFTFKKVKVFGLIIIGVLSVTSISYVLLNGELFNKIWQKDGIFSYVLSYRNQLFLEEMIPFINEQWRLPNYLFGGINAIKTRPQMALFDLFYFFGLIGSMIYIWSFNKIFFTFKLKGNALIYLVALLFIVILSGNFLLNASIVIYILILRELLIRDQYDSQI